MSAATLLANSLSLTLLAPRSLSSPSEQEKVATVSEQVREIAHSAPQHPQLFILVKMVQRFVQRLVVRSIDLV